MLRNAPVNLHNLIIEIHILDRKLQALEEKYNLLSADFYQLYEAGQWIALEIEVLDEFGQWAAWCRMRAQRIGQYEALKNTLIANLSHRPLFQHKAQTGVSPYPKGSTPATQRVGNLHPGNFRMSEDFDAPLPDEFWLGES